MKTWNLILWPLLITLAVSIARITGEVQGWITQQSGGAGFWLGISWLPFVFGGYFGLRLSRAGSRPRLSPAWLYALLAFGLLVATVLWRFGPLLEADPSDETIALLRVSVLIITSIAITLAIAMAFVWPRLVWILFCYALPTRLVVVALTWLAKQQGWHTHYTKFGPTGIEVDMSTTLVSATIAQCGFWIPFTILAGTLVGTWFGRRRSN